MAEAPRPVSNRISRGLSRGANTSYHSGDMPIPYMCLFATLLTSARFQSNTFADTPENHWAYEAISDLKSSGIVVGFPDGLGRGIRPQGRYEMAVAANAACNRLHAIVDGFRASNSKIALSRSTDEEAKALRSDLTGRYSLRSAMPRHADELHRLIAEFKHELKVLGVNPDQTYRQVTFDAATVLSLRVATPGEALEQFPDVPTNHWAAQAVQNLRANGIIKGYPSGAFTKD